MSKERKSLCEKQLEYYQFGANAFPVKEPVGDMSKWKYVFISGLPRSGTTALGDLLNLSNDIAIYTELYDVWCPYKIKNFNEATVKNIVANHPHQDRNLTILNKAKNASFVGDKRPLFHVNCAQTLSNFRKQDISVFHIYRNIEDVALSYQSRADNSNDSWNSRKGMLEAVEDMNKMNQLFYDLDKSVLDNFIFVAYDNCFTSVDYVMNIFSKLQVVDDNESLYEKVTEFIARSKGVVMKERPINQHQIEKILGRIDWYLLSYVEKHFGIKMLGPAMRTAASEYLRNKFSTLS